MIDPKDDVYIDDFDDEGWEAESEEAPIPGRANRRLTHKQVAHIPRPRHKQRPQVQVAPLEETTEDEITDGVAPATESVIEADVVSDQGHAAPKKQKKEKPVITPKKHQKPMTYGSVDG